ncbi:hypothetical protein [Marimonas arenosa]|uniref:Uncharacterized protein n=1 Tax=Marimonas arenosa TaxID=1795305 RepID=A0AAE3WC45_9RHOB|nr:hypothetical protein [Marimonas arenosa]MDQ2090496.1 hypothetical protein [Marimonas arenosa]
MSGRYEEPFPLRRMVVHPVFWGVVASLAVVALVIWWGVQEQCGITGSCETRFAQVLGSKPAEFATVVGGAALVLIWVWLVVLVWVQARAVKVARMGLDAREHD